MTKENREKAYKHFRDLEKNYEAREGLNSGPTATSKVRAESKKSADAILKKHPELAEPVEKPKAKAGKTKTKPKKVEEDGEK